MGRIKENLIDQWLCLNFDLKKSFIFSRVCACVSLCTGIQVPLKVRTMGSSVSTKSYRQL